MRRALLGLGLVAVNALLPSAFATTHQAASTLPLRHDVTRTTISVGQDRLTAIEVNREYR